METLPQRPVQTRYIRLALGFDLELKGERSRLRKYLTRCTIEGKIEKRKTQPLCFVPLWPCQINLNYGRSIAPAYHIIADLFSSSAGDSSGGTCSNHSRESKAHRYAKQRSKGRPAEERYYGSPICLRLDRWRS